MNPDVFMDVLTRYGSEIFDWAGNHVRRIITNELNLQPARTAILDVGAGQGKYRVLLSEYPHVDGVEVWEPYIVQNRLHELYRVMIHDNVTRLAERLVARQVRYDVVIMGDVLEHVPTHDAIELVTRMRAITDELIIVVPYAYPQGPEHDNPYQRHEQDDLTVELMHERYPALRLATMQLDAADRPFKGLYRWR